MAKLKLVLSMHRQRQNDALQQHVRFGAVHSIHAGSSKDSDPVGMQQSQSITLAEQIRLANSNTAAKTKLYLLSPIAALHTIVFHGMLSQRPPASVYLSGRGIPYSSNLYQLL